MSDFGSGMLAGVIVGAFLTILLFTEISVPNKTLIDSGCAYYHPTTGDITWGRKPINTEEK